MMKSKWSYRIFGILLSGCLVVGSGTVLAAGQTQTGEQAQVAEEQLDGGWSVNQGKRLRLDKHVRQVFDKALNGLVGADYEPVALLGTQVVAGTNYAILCRITPVVLHPVTKWGVAYVYEDLQGNAKLLKVKDLELGL